MPPPLLSPHSASPIMTPEDNVLRRLHIPYGQHRPLFTGLPSAGTGPDVRGDYWEMPSTEDHQSNRLHLTEDSFHQNIPDVRRSQLGIAGLQSEGGSVFPSQTQHRGQSVERWQSRVNDHPHTQEAAQRGRSYYPPAVIVRKSSHVQAARPFHPGFQVWDPEGAQRSNTGKTVQGRDAQTEAEDKNFWQSSDVSHFSPHTARHSPPPSKGHYSGHKETNELAAVGPLSTPRAIQSSKSSSFASQTAPHGPSVRNSLDTSAAKSHPSPGNLPSSITAFSHSSQTPRYKTAQSYLFRDSPSPSVGRETVDPVAADGHDVFSPSAYKQGLSDARAYGRPSSERNQPRQVQHVRFHRANPLHHEAKVDQYSAQTHSFTTAQTQISAQPVSGRKGHNTTDSEKSVARSLFNVTARGSMHADNPGRTAKRLYGFRGFRRPTWRAVMEPFSLSNQSFTSGRHSFDKRRFKMVNVYPSSPKYSFGQRDASRTSTNYSSSSPGMLGVVQTTATSRPLGFQEAGPLLPENDAHMDSYHDGRPSKSARRIFGLKGFGIRPLEGAKPFIKEPDQNARVQQGFKGFQFRSSGSSRIHRWDNKTEPGSRSEPRSEDLKQVNQFTPDEYKKRSKTYPQLGFDPGQTGNSTSRAPWKHKERASAGHSISPTYLGSDPGVDPRPEPEPPSRTKPAPLPAHLPNSPTRSEVRGHRVRGNATRKKLNESLTSKAGNAAIVRLSSRLARLKAVTYTDILGSASFSGVRGTIQTPVTPADKDYFPTAMTHQEEVAGNWTLNSEDAVQSRGNASQSPEAHTDGEEAINGDMTTSDLFLDNEGSGSGGFNTSNVSPSHPMTQRLSEDLLDLDYLRISAGNISFKSMKQSHTEK